MSNSFASVLQHLLSGPHYLTVPSLCRILCALLLCFSLTSCVTRELFDSGQTHDQVNAFFGTSDGKSFVAIGQEYHYIFPLTGVFYQMGNWPGRKYISSSFWGRKKGNTVQGYYWLRAEDNQLSPADRHYLASLGFQLKSAYAGNGQKAQYFWIYNGQMQGTSYRAKPLPLSRSVQIRQPVHVLLSNEDTLPVTMAKIAVTPITVTTDGILLLGGAALVGVYATACVFETGYCQRDDS